jgi:23S rRNA pseudouridine955/2504/2580 synthase
MEKIMPMKLQTGEDDRDRRLDRILRKARPDLPLSGIHRLLRTGRILVNGKPARAEDRIPPGSVISLPDDVSGPSPASRPPPSPGQAGQGLDILYEGSGLLILNKKPGIAVHGPESLDTLVQAYLRGRLKPSLSFRPGPLHRLDKPSGGIVVFSTDLEGARRFSALLRERRIGKQYLALVEGRVGEAETWQDPLYRDRRAKKTGTGSPDKTVRGEDGTKQALTRIKPLAAADGYSLILAEIQTGRTHQIRAQAAAHKHPLGGDTKYGGRPLRGAGGFFLHAWRMQFPAGAFPANKDFPRLISAPLPASFRSFIDDLFGRKAPKLS